MGTELRGPGLMFVDAFFTRLRQACPPRRDAPRRSAGSFTPPAQGNCVPVGDIYR
jgi:hypothetical protein